VSTRTYPFAVLLVAALLVAVAPAAAAPVWSAASSAARARRFWTPARMSRARPLEAPGRGGRGLASSAGPASASDVGRDDSDFAPVTDPTAPGFRQNGAIFAVLPHGFGLARCSGTSVDTPNRSVVVTAGHCVSDFGHWLNQDWVFVPGYHDGVRPFGIFVAKWLGTTPSWFSGNSENVDVGAAVVYRNERGQRLGDAVGGDGIAFGLPPGQVFDVHGYPVAPPFDGASQRICAGTPFLGHDLLSFTQPGPLNLGLTCEVTGGASGGGWTIDGNVLDGVTDYGYGDAPTTTFGAYFGGAVKDLYRRAARVR
jgi:hypothetical protein